MIELKTVFGAELGLVYHKFDLVLFEGEAALLKREICGLD
jgi:hypothetical protein